MRKTSAAQGGLKAQAGPGTGREEDGAAFWMGALCDCRWKEGQKGRHSTSLARVKGTQGRAVGTKKFKEKVIKNSPGADRTEHKDRRGRWSLN